MPHYQFSFIHQKRVYQHDLFITQQDAKNIIQALDKDEAELEHNEIYDCGIYLARDPDVDTTCKTLVVELKDFCNINTKKRIPEIDDISEKIDELNAPKEEWQLWFGWTGGFDCDRIFSRNFCIFADGDKGGDDKGGGDKDNAIFKKAIVELLGGDAYGIEIAKLKNINDADCHQFDKIRKNLHDMAVKITAFEKAIAIIERRDVHAAELEDKVAKGMAAMRARV
jgi:hypothetical protein